MVALQRLSESREIRLFPGSLHFISYYTGTHGNPIWNSKAGLYGHYILTMQMPITLEGWGRDRIGSHDSPTFFLVEVQSILPFPNGQTSINCGDTQITFGLSEWEKLVESGGDLSVLGVKVKKDEKIPGFDEHWQGG